MVYDKFFETVHSKETEVPLGWEDLVRYSSDRVIDDDNAEYIPKLADEWLDD